MRIKYLIYIFLLFTNCQVKNESVKNKNIEKEQLNEKSLGRTSIGKDTLKSENKVKTPITILVLPTNNSYEYVMHGYNFTPIIETELRKFGEFEILPFPYKKLEGINFYGVYKLKDCRQYCLK